jgi:hypothetical protein
VLLRQAAAMPVVRPQLGIGDARGRQFVI